MATLDIVTGHVPLDWLAERGIDVSPPLVPPYRVFAGSGYGQRGGRLHAGADMVNSAPSSAPASTPRWTPEGAAVLCVMDGARVTHASSVFAPGFSGFGRVVALELPERPYHVLYAHLGSVAVSVGDVLEAGARIGTVGRTGFTTQEPARLISGPHLHFEVATRPYPLPRRTFRVDPVAWLNARNIGPSLVASSPRRRGVGGGTLVLGAALCAGAWWLLQPTGGTSDE